MCFFFHSPSLSLFISFIFLLRCRYCTLSYIHIYIYGFCDLPTSILERKHGMNMQTKPTIAIIIMRIAKPWWFFRIPCRFVVIVAVVGVSEHTFGEAHVLWPTSSHTTDYTYPHMICAVCSEFLLFPTFCSVLIFHSNILRTQLDIDEPKGHSIVYIMDILLTIVRNGKKLFIIACRIEKHTLTQQSASFCHLALFYSICSSTIMLATTPSTMDDTNWP